MPIFELDEGRPRLVQPMQPLPGSFGQECAALLTHHLAAVAGEPLFVVRPRAAVHEHADVPELLALDSTGRPVIVEVVQVVDDDAVVAALRHAGAAARMTTTDLARAYHPDPSRFPVDFAAFREQVAFGATTSRREGVRLILLCSEVASEAGDTLSFLRGPGRHVDVLQVGVMRGVDERRLVDVSPLAAHETTRRSVEPTALRLVRSSEAFATAMAYDPGRASRPPTGLTPPGGAPVVGAPGTVLPAGSPQAAPPFAPPVPAAGAPSAFPLAPPPARQSDPVEAPRTPASEVSSRKTSTQPTPLPFGSGAPSDLPAELPEPAAFSSAPDVITPVSGLRVAADQRPPTISTGPGGYLLSPTAVPGALHPSDVPHPHSTPVPAVATPAAPPASTEPAASAFEPRATAPVVDMGVSATGSPATELAEPTARGRRAASVPEGAETSDGSASDARAGSADAPGPGVGGIIECRLPTR